MAGDQCSARGGIDRQCEQQGDDEDGLVERTGSAQQHAAECVVIVRAREPGNFKTNEQAASEGEGDRHDRQQSADRSVARHELDDFAARSVGAAEDRRQEHGARNQHDAGQIAVVVEESHCRGAYGSCCGATSSFKRSRPAILRQSNWIHTGHIAPINKSSLAGTSGSIYRSILDFGPTNDAACCANDCNSLTHNGQNADQSSR